MNSGHNVIARYLTASGESGKNAKAISDGHCWVLATLIARVGSSYRKEGAMMFVSPSGERIGVLSGGCLEADIVHKAHQVAYLGEAKLIEYDSLEDGYQIGTKNTGCLGKIEILLLPISEQIQLEIEQLYQQLELGHSCIVSQRLPLSSLSGGNGERPFFYDTLNNSPAIELAGINIIDNQQYAVSKVKPREKLLIIGAGHDVIPLGQIAKQLGWYLHLWDERRQSIGSEHAGCADYLDRRQRKSIEDFSFIKSFDGVLLKSHNLEIDSFWLSTLQCFQQELDYIGMLGPEDRKQVVIAQAKLEHADWPQQKILSPAGLSLGGDSPESIALSIVAQAHQIFNANNG